MVVVLGVVGLQTVDIGCDAEVVGLATDGYVKGLNAAALRLQRL